MSLVLPAAADFYRLSIHQAGELLRSGSVTSTQITMHALHRIRAEDGAIRSFVTVTEQCALAEAAAADADFAMGRDRGPMQGIPYALKDIFDTAGIRTTAQSRLFIDRHPTADSAVAERLRLGGAVLLGKLSTYECATVGPDWSLPFEPARNPWNTDHITGGSSSGAGAAVAAGFVRVAIGTDTAGSIRGPAGYCGVVGLKPTFGLVSRRGSLPMSWSLDHCGVIAKSAEDAAIAMNVISGHDPLDRATFAREGNGFSKDDRLTVNKLRIGVPRHFFTKDSNADGEVVKAMDRTLDALARRGAEIDDVTLPSYEVFSACGRVIMLAEAFSIHEQAFRKTPEKFGKHMFQWMSSGAFISASDYINAKHLRDTLSGVIDRMLLKYDVLATASIMTPAPRFDALPREEVPQVDMQCFPANVTGNPAIGIPTGFAENGLPLSMQMIGTRCDDARLLKIAGTLDEETNQSRLWPDRVYTDSQFTALA